MHKTDFLPATFVEPLLEYLQARQIDDRALETELQQVLQSSHVCARQFCDLLERLHRHDPVSALGVRLGRAAQPRHFGVVGYMLSSCSTLGQALPRYQRYHALLQQGLHSRAWLGQGVLHMRWSQAVANTPLALEFSLVVFVSLYQSLIGRAQAPLHAGLPFARPADSDVYQVLLGCPVQFGCAEIELNLPAHLLAMPIASKDPYLLKLLEQQAQALLSQQPEHMDADSEAFFVRVQEQVVESMKNGDASAEAVAAALGYSLRSFYRQLQQAGYSYRSVLAQTRHTLARQYLRDPNLTQSDAALLLGYAEQSSFIRAFRSWIGITPGEYRQRHLQQRGGSSPAQAS